MISNRLNPILVVILIGKTGPLGVLGSWFLVLGSWFLVLGSWFLVLGYLLRTSSRPVNPPEISGSMVDFPTPIPGFTINSTPIPNPTITAEIVTISIVTVPVSDRRKRLSISINIPNYHLLCPNIGRRTKNVENMTWTAYRSIMVGIWRFNMRMQIVTGDIKLRY